MKTTTTKQIMMALLVLFQSACAVDGWNGQENDLLFVPYTLPLTILCESDNDVPCEDVQQSIDYWHEQVARDYLFEIAGSPDISHNITVHFGTPPNGWVGVAYYKSEGESCRIVLRDDLPTTSYSSVLSHELGHCLGLADDYGTPYIMNGNGWVSTDPDVSPNDIDLIQGWAVEGY